MFEISAKRLDVFQFIVLSISLYFRNPRLQATPGYWHALWQRSCLLYSWNATRPVDSSGDKRKRIWLERKLGKASISNRLVGKSFWRNQCWLLKIVKEAHPTKLGTFFFFFWRHASFSLWLTDFLNDFHSSEVSFLSAVTTHKCYFHCSILGLDGAHRVQRKFVYANSTFVNHQVEPGSM